MPNITSPLAGKRAAIVEDEAITQILLRRALKATGAYIIGTAGTAQEGIDLVFNQRPDLVLMDINMPGSLNGLDAAEVIVIVFHICVVMLTGYDEEAYRSRADKIPTCGYLIKPVIAATLIPALERCFTAWEEGCG